MCPVTFIYGVYFHKTHLALPGFTTFAQLEEVRSGKEVYKCGAEHARLYRKGSDTMIGCPAKR